MSKKTYWVRMPVTFDKEADKVIGLECHHGNHLGEERSLKYARRVVDTDTIVVACPTCKREFYLFPDVCP